MSRWGPGRGSAAGSLIIYALGITTIDPLHYGLIFERFLNPERISMPDIDIDFCAERRESVLEHVAAEYGKDRVGPDHHLHSDWRRAPQSRIRRGCWGCHWDWASRSPD